MATGEALTPIDSLTKQPYPIFFTPEDLILEGRFHHAEHNRYRPELQDSVGKLLRWSRTYWVPDVYHRADYLGSYHDRFKGPRISKDTILRHSRAVINLARVMPRKAFDFRNGKFVERVLNDKEHAFLSSPEIMKIDKGHRPEASQRYKRDMIGAHLVDYALQPEFLDTVPRLLVEKFLTAEDEAALQELGGLIIKRAVYESIKPATEIYRDAIDNGMVSNDQPPMIPTILSYLPEHSFGEYYSRIKATLGAAKEGIDSSEDLATQAA